VTAPPAEFTKRCAEEASACLVSGSVGIGMLSSAKATIAAGPSVTEPISAQAGSTPSSRAAAVLPNVARLAEKEGSLVRCQLQLPGQSP
jgi:hypothetical protein